MKKILFLAILLFSSLAMSAQDIQKMQEEIEALKSRVTILERIISSRIIDSNSAQTNPASPVTTEASTSAVQTTSEKQRCKAITNAGSQCKRNADPGSDYCWQHKSTYEPTKSSTTSSSRTIYTGPRGGRYYINSNGNKTYIKR